MPRSLLASCVRAGAPEGRRTRIELVGQQVRSCVQRGPRALSGGVRHHGFRPSKRYIVFQVLPDTLGLGPEVWRILSKAHDLRNRTEYEGAVDVDERLVADLIGACRTVAEKVRHLPALP